MRPFVSSLELDLAVEIDVDLQGCDLQRDLGRKGLGALDLSGAAYLTGVTSSANFPSVNPLLPYSGDEDVFVANLNAAGFVLVAFPVVAWRRTRSQVAGTAPAT